MIKIRGAGGVCKKNTERRGPSGAKYGEQGNYPSKMQRVGGLFKQKMESRGTITGSGE